MRNPALLTFHALYIITARAENVGTIDFIDKDFFFLRVSHHWWYPEWVGTNNNMNNPALLTFHAHNSKSWYENSGIILVDEEYF